MVGYIPGLDTVPPVPLSSDPEKQAPPATAAADPPIKPIILSMGTLHGDMMALPSVAEQEQERREKSILAGKILGFLVFTSALLGVFAFVFFWIPTTIPQSPSYSVSIDTFSGLDPGTDLRLPMLNPAFNLTFHVTSESHHDNACIEPGTYLEVAYRCFKLATTATVQQSLCAGPNEAAEQKLVARGTGVRMLGSMLDSLAADMRQAELVFQVTIRQSGGDYADDMLVASCGGRRVGAAADDLGTRCDAWHLCA